MQIAKTIIYFLAIISSMLSAIETEKLSANEKYVFIKEIYDKSWALLIGINDYEHVDKLSYAVDDAESIKDILINQYGFDKNNILLIKDKEATKANIEAGFQNILLQAGEKDRVVVFYAGHGETYPLPSGGEMGYLIPVDGEATKEKIFLTSIPMATIEQIANMSAAKHILYLVDACYGGLSLNMRGLSKEHTPEYLRKITKEKGRQIITAGGKDEPVIERPEWGHSAFTRNLIKGLKEELADSNDDGVITGEELGIFIRDRVTLDSDGTHTPQKGRIGSDMGEFVFISQTTMENVELAVVEENKITAMESEMAEIKELLLQSQAQSQSQEEYPQMPSIPSKSKKEISIKTASTLAWVFPGMGHYYSGRSAKGLLFSGLELAAVAGIAITSSNYFEKVDEYNTFENNQVAGNWNTSDEKKLFQAKNDAIPALIGSCTAAGVVWIWNIWDIKKTGYNQYSNASPVSIGLNSRGQLETSITF